MTDKITGYEPQPLNKLRQRTETNKHHGRNIQSIEHFTSRMDELRSLGLPCDPIQILMEVAIGKKLVLKIGCSGDRPEDYNLEYLIGGYDKKGHPIDVDAATKAKAASELLSYIYPKRKAIEVTGEAGSPISFAVIADQGPLPLEQPVETSITIEGRPEDISLAQDSDSSADKSAEFAGDLSADDVQLKAKVRQLTQGR